jgi:hypothetical protein
VRKEFLERISENPKVDPIGLLYEILASQANSILGGEEFFVVYPNSLCTKIYCRDEEYIRSFLEFLKEADIMETERSIVETACREAGIKIPDFSCFFQQ